MAKKVNTPTPSSEPLSRKDVKELLQLIRENNIQEFSLEQGDVKIRIVTSGGGSSAPSVSAPQTGGFAGYPVAPPHYMMPMGYAPAPAAPAAAVAPPAAPVAAAPAAAPASPAGPAAGAAAAAAAAAEDENPRWVKINSPMVGTFYRAPAPDAKNFVEVGSQVTEDTVLCIVEAMKLMNEIKAEMRGTIKKILVQNGKPVEYGQPLFLVDPA